MAAVDRTPRRRAWPLPPAFAYPASSVYGIREDGRVDVTADEAWPSRPHRSPLPEPREVAEACAALTACLFSMPFASSDDLAARLYVQYVCPFGALLPFGGSTAESAFRASAHGGAYSVELRVPGTPI